MRTRSKIGSIIGSTAVAIFSLVAAFSGSIAWFNANRETSITSDEFKVTSGGINVVDRIYFYKYSETTKKNGVDHYVFSDQQGRVEITGSSAQYIGNIAMNEYSLSAPHSPVLMLLELKEGTEIASFRAMTSSPYMASNGGSVRDRDDQNNNKNPLSSVIEFHYFTYASDDALNGSKINNHYAISTASFTSSNQTSFAEFDENGNYDKFCSDISLFSGDTTNVKYIGIVIDYYSESLQNIYSYYLGLSSLNKGLLFRWDWELFL